MEKNISIYSNFFDEYDLFYLLRKDEIKQNYNKIIQKYNENEETDKDISNNECVIQPISQSFTISLIDKNSHIQSIRNQLISKFPSLKNIETIPMKWVIGNVESHIDKAADNHEFKKTILVYLTEDYNGIFTIANQQQYIERNKAFVFSFGLEHSVKTASAVPRLIMGPMNENGEGVGNTSGYYFFANISDASNYTNQINFYPPSPNNFILSASQAGLTIPSGYIFLGWFNSQSQYQFGTDGLSTDHLYVSGEDTYNASFVNFAIFLYPIYEPPPTPTPIPNYISVPISDVCFTAGNMVLTTQSYVPIEQLDKNKHEIYQTSTSSKKIKEITKTQNWEKKLVCINKSAFEKNVPNKTTMITKSHKIYYKGKFQTAEDILLQHEQQKKFPKSIFYVPYTGQILYNVLLDDLPQHSEAGTMVVNGLLVESLHPENPIALLYSSLSGILTNSEKTNIINTYNRLVFENKKREEKQKHKRCLRIYK
jgi:hypothetical protein